MSRLPAAQQPECLREGTCGCASLFDCGVRPALIEIAGHVAPRQGDVLAAWQRALETSGLRVPRSPEDERAEAADLLQTLARGDPPLIAAGLLSIARRLRDSGASLQVAIAAGELFARAIAAVAAAPPRVAAPLQATDRLAWLAASLAAIAFTADEPASRVAEHTPGLRTQLCGIIGATQVMRRLYARIELAARGRETALIIGESGVGKELVARAVHQLSGDQASSFVAVNCAALPRDLIEAELFGYRRGAFTGAVASHPGLVRAAEGGTLFLDEISELSPEAQAKLLRLMQEHSVRAVGAVEERPVNVRIVAATNRPPQEAMQAGLLRRDLYYRLQRFVLDVPPLRDRMSDIPALVAVFAERWRAAYGAPRAKSFSAAAIERLCLHEWPGNVRELENVVFQSSSAAPGAVVRGEDLEIRDETRPAEASEPSARAPVSMREAERVAIGDALRRAERNKSLAARILGISRKQLYAKIRLYGLED